MSKGNNCTHQWRAIPFSMDYSGKAADLTKFLQKEQVSLGRLVFLFLGCLLLAGTVAVAANPAGTSTDPLNNDPLVREAYQHFYILDYEGALQRFQKVEQLHPNEPIAAAYVLNCTLFRELYRLDLLDTTFYANDGFLTGKHPVPEDPNARDLINSLAEKTVTLSEERLKKNPRDTNALFARGWARSLKAAYLAMVERGFSSGLHLALQARSDHEKVLEIDPNYVDAKMVVGIYQYVVGALPLPFKIMIGFAGIHGSKQRGMEMLRDSAARGTITTVESRTVIALFLRREAKYQEAIGVVRSLKAEYPRDFLYCLEEANLEKDVGNGPAAIATYSSLVELAKKKDYFPNAHLELAWFGLAETLRGQRQYPDAAKAYNEAAYQPGAGAELKRRSLVAEGNIYDLMHERENALKAYHAAIDVGGDSTQADQARKFIRSPYSGN